MPSSRSTACLPIIQEGMWIVFSPFAFIGMLLFILGSDFIGETAVLCGIVFSIMFSIIQYVFEKCNRNLDVFENGIVFNKAGPVTAIKDKGVLMSTDDTQKDHIISRRYQMLSSTNNHAQSRFIQLYKNVMQCCTTGYNLSCSLLIHSYIYIIANQLSWNTSFNSHVIPSIMLALTSAYSNLGSMFLPVSVRNWYGVVSCLFGFAGVTTWMLTAPARDASVPYPPDNAHFYIHSLIYVGFIVHGIGAFKVSARAATERNILFKWLSIGASQCISIVTSSIPGMLCLNNQSLNFSSILAHTPDVSDVLALPARICCILGLIGANLTVVSRLYKPHAATQKKSWMQVSWNGLVTLLPSVIVMLINIFASDILPEVVHCTVLVAGGILAPFIALILPLILSASNNIPKIGRSICYLLVLIIAILVAYTTSFALSKPHLPFEVGTGMKYVTGTDTSSMAAPTRPTTAPDGKCHTYKTMFNSQDLSRFYNVLPTPPKLSSACGIELPPIAMNCRRTLRSFKLFEPCQLVYYNDARAAIVFKHPTEGLLGLFDLKDQETAHTCSNPSFASNHLVFNSGKQPFGPKTKYNRFVLAKIDTEKLLSILLNNHIDVRELYKSLQKKDLAMCSVNYTPDNGFIVYSTEHGGEINMHQVVRSEDEIFTVSPAKMDLNANCVAELHANIASCPELDMHLTNICRASMSQDNIMSIIYKLPNSYWKYITVTRSHLNERKGHSSCPGYACLSAVERGGLEFDILPAESTQLRQLYMDLFTENEQGRPLTRSITCIVKHADEKRNRAILLINYNNSKLIFDISTLKTCISWQESDEI